MKRLDKIMMLLDDKTKEEYLDIFMSDLSIENFTKYVGLAKKLFDETYVVEQFIDVGTGNPFVNYALLSKRPSLNMLSRAELQSAEPLAECIVDNQKSKNGLWNLKNKLLLGKKIAGISSGYETHYCNQANVYDLNYIK